MVHIRKKWVSALFRRWNLRVFGGKEGKNGKSVEKKRTRGAADGAVAGGMAHIAVRSPSAYSAASTRVLSAEYSTTLRKAQSCAPHGRRMFSGRGACFAGALFPTSAFSACEPGFRFLPFLSFLRFSLLSFVPPARSLAFSIRWCLNIRIFNP